MATATTIHYKEPATETHKKEGPAKKGRYTEAVGRRKTSVARVRLMPGSGKFTVNGKDAKAYFTLPRLVQAAKSPLEQLQLTDFDVSVKVSGGGIHAQADAVRLGISRAIILKDPAWKPRLRTMGFLTRDSRMVERKKYGKLGARRSPQWAKR
ncbi:MAG: 30S ribosomal protein S9 [Candidatus Pacebacteria bacterium]|nr:30S ribosomal protein S9 [Candidatus Paceibacterota bacterium]